MMEAAMDTITEKRVTGISREPQPHWVGDGFPVRTLLSVQREGARISPFLLFDYAGPRHFPPAEEPRGVGQHPHRGFETVTILYQGEVEHRDSAGNAGRIGPGDVQWMTAASGVLHEEFHSREFTRRGGEFEAVQLWVNLPAQHKMDAPRYQTLLNADIPVVALPDGAGQLRVIAGRFSDRQGPAQTFTPVNLWDVQLKAGKVLELSLPGGSNTTVALLRGRIMLNGETPLAPVQAAHFSREGERIRLQASEDAVLLVLNGTPIEEPIASYGPFVMNTRQEIEQALADYQNGRMGALSGPGA
jgi:redox-sensitive bicupin YhaK (pirin superfamily)